MTDSFDSAGSTSDDHFRVSDSVGHLVLISPTQYIESIDTTFGEKDAVNANVADLTSGVDFEDSLIFQGGLIKVLKVKAKKGSGMVLGVIGKGEAKKGLSAPYILDAPTEAQKQQARDYLNKKDDPFAV